jgi:hypothetical protein
VKNLNDKKLQSQVNPQFLKETEDFKAMLHSKLAPKKSINEGEFVTGEGIQCLFACSQYHPKGYPTTTLFACFTALAALVQLFVEALNTPGTVPNVQNAWDTFVHTKCTEVLAASLNTYKEEMTSRVKHQTPCEAEVIRSAHLESVDACFEMFRQETFTLSIKSVDKYLKELKVSFIYFG